MFFFFNFLKDELSVASGVVDFVMKIRKPDPHIARWLVTDLILRDSRLSLEERYGNQQGYVDAVRRAAERLVQDRFLLPEDAERRIREATARPILP